MAYPLGMGGYPNRMYSPVNVGTPSFSGSELSSNPQDADFTKVLERIQAQQPQQASAKPQQQQQNFQGLRPEKKSGIDPITGALAMGGAAGAGYHLTQKFGPSPSNDTFVKAGGSYKSAEYAKKMAEAETRLGLLEEIQSKPAKELSAEAVSLKKTLGKTPDIAAKITDARTAVATNEAYKAKLEGKTVDVLNQKGLKPINAEIVSDQKTLTLLDEISGKKSKLSPDAEKLLEKLKADNVKPGDLAKATRANLATNEAKIAMNTARKTAASEAKVGAKNIFTELKELAKNRNTDDIAKKELVDKITKTAKGKWGKIVAGVAALGALAYMSFRD